jgi:hypothetical protein
MGCGWERGGGGGEAGGRAGFRLTIIGLVVVAIPAVASGGPVPMRVLGHGRGRRWRRCPHGPHLDHLGLKHGGARQQSLHTPATQPRAGRRWWGGVAWDGGSRGGGGRGDG